MHSEHDALDRYLDEVATHLRRRDRRGDLLAELRSAILDRAEEIGGGTIDPESLDGAIAKMGEPAELASAYAGERYLIGPRMFTPFLVYTGILFAVHVLVIAIASVLDADVEFLPFTVVRAVHPPTLMNLVLAAVQALIFDIGLMVVIFAAMGQARRTVRLPSVVFRVRPDLRGCVSRAAFTVLVLLLFNVFRDDVFMVVREGRPRPIFTSWFVDCLPWINAFLVVLVLKEIAYALKGERAAILAADGVLSLLGAALMIVLLTRPALVSFPAELNAPNPALPTLNQIAHKIAQLLLIAFAAGLVLQGAKRLFRAAHRPR